MVNLVLLSTILLIGSVFGKVLKAADEVSVVNDDLLSLQYRLTGDIRPSFYDVELIIDPNDDSGFSGAVSIRVIPQVDLLEFKLHAMELDVKNITVTAVSNPEVDLFLNSALANDDTHFLTIYLNSPLQAFTPYLVNINYDGSYAENMFGVYVSTYNIGTTSRRLVTSQLQPTFARRAFPCFDEPGMKAIFRTTIYAPAEFTTVRSNMPLRTDLQKENIVGYTKHEFEDTLVMSSYIQAYLISDFGVIENTANDIYRLPFRVFSRTGTQAFGEFAVDYGQRNMVALEDYMGLDYAFPKVDNVAVPDFVAGAMENWGLVIYREVALLYQPGVTSISIKQNIGRIICHENLHFWFGNEVSPVTWTYTWLNEGFANLFESFGTNMVLPEWRMMEQFVINMQNVFQADAVLGVNPMTHPVYTPSQTMGTFNAVAYQKSGSVLRMLQHMLTPPVFQEGLNHYLVRHAKTAVTPAELFQALQDIVDTSNITLPASVATIMNHWTNQGGFPVILVRRTALSASSVVITQERFLTDESQSSSDRWYIPVNWALSTNPEFNDTSPQGWVNQLLPATAISVPGLPEAEWFIFNKQQTGYYRVNYDESNWVALGKALDSDFEVIHNINRAQLVDDAFNLARNSRLDYSIVFDLVKYLENEPDYIPWAAANAGFAYLETILSGTGVYNIYQRFLLQLSAPLYSTLGFTGTDEEHVTAFHRNIILNLNCRNGNQLCLTAATNMVHDLQDGGDSLNPDIQTTVYCSSLRGGCVHNYDYLWNLFLESTDSSQQSILLSALGCTSNSEKLESYINQMISDDSQVRVQDRHSILVSIINASPANREVALDFIVENFAAIQQNVQGLSGTTNILNALSRTLTNSAQLEKISTLKSRYADILTPAELASIAAIEENIGASVTWTSKHYGVVDTWLRANNSAHYLTGSLVILLSFALAFFHI